MTTEKLLLALKKYRLENRISQTGLAELLGVSFATVNRWLNGHHEPNELQRFQIEKLLKGRKK